ncbi:hypothetical protein GUJ93_ZPchr0286g2802 [Zizania palustris]|uniref:Leucine-rich repeat-containing N-terminal plant-type domain-containing protein n=1 Tax=Zizania palustris TaxID=103762 RepID=A0A8J5TEC4_ZIZPA|nr:hypothetical protein GUJ93_ZPchr0286g2802 [Zizania palustris]
MAPPSGPAPCMAPSRLPMPAGRHMPAEPTEPGRPVEPIRSVRLLLLIAALALLQAAVAAIHPADLAVLHDLQRSLTNADVLAWPANTDPCAWPHISCDRADRVNNMDLKNAGLAGWLPPTFATLDALEGLNLQNNSLSSPLLGATGCTTAGRRGSLDKTKN